MGHKTKVKPVGNRPPAPPPQQGIKKLNKQQRERKRAEHAETFGEGFDHGYIMGYEQGFKDAQLKGHRNAVKWASFGR